MRSLSITGMAAVALLSGGLVSEASAQSGRGQGQAILVDLARSLDPGGVLSGRRGTSRNDGVLRRDDVLRGRTSRGGVFGARNDDSDSDSDRRGKGKGHLKGKHKHKHKGNCTGNDDVIGQTSSRLPSRVCVDANGDGICDSRTADQRRPRTRTGTNGDVILGRRSGTNQGVVLGRRAPGTLLAQQVGLALIQRYAYQQALARQQAAIAYQQRVAYAQRGIR